MLDVDFDEPAGEPPALMPAVQNQRRRAPKEEPRDYLTNPMQVQRSIGRSLPHSLEAEELLISMAMMDGADVVSRCEEAGIREQSFYLAAHQIIYGIVRRLWIEKKETDITFVIEELKRSKQLESVGGYPFMTQVSSRVGTTGQAGFFIEKVRQYALQREFIKRTTGAVEEAYSLTSDVDAFIESTHQTIKAIGDGSSIAQAEKLAARLYDPKKKIPRPEPIYLLAGTQIATPGNLTAIYSQAKTGKSALIGACMAATMTTPTAGFDTLGVSGPNYANHAVIHVDTEQSLFDWQQLLNSALRRIGREIPPEWLLSYNFTGSTPRDNMAMLELALRTAKKRFGGIHSVIIDGIADMVVDPNDSEECFPLITRLHSLAIEHNTAIISVLHMNPGMDTKGRGHLGSQLERKCESNITLEKDGSEVTKVFSTKQRGKSIQKDSAPSFRWSDDKMMHVSCDTPPPDSRNETRGRPESYEFSIFKSVIPRKDEAPVTIAQLASRCSANKEISSKQMWNVVQRWIESGVLECVDIQGQPKRYRATV